MTDRRSILTALALLPLWPRMALARVPEIFAPGGIALGGTDVVAYAQGGGPVVGDSRFALMWRGAVWHFANAATMEAFEMNPARYCPAYGGHCARALAKGEVLPTLREAFEQHDGRLFLFSTQAARAEWLAQPAAIIAQADTNWPGMLRG